MSRHAHLDAYPRTPTHTHRPTHRYIPENVFGTNAYHPPEVDACERRTPPDEIVAEVKEFYEDYLGKLYDRDTKIALTYDKEPARQDSPYGSSDLFGCGALLAELLYGIFEQIESGGNWTHLLFPMSEPEEKKAILARIHLHGQGGPQPEGALRGFMIDRCEFAGEFTAVIDAAFEMGVGDLLLKCLEPDPKKRILVEAALEHPFWTAEIPG